MLERPVAYTVWAEQVMAAENHAQQQADTFAPKGFG